MDLINISDSVSDIALTRRLLRMEKEGKITRDQFEVARRVFFGEFAEFVSQNEQQEDYENLPMDMMIDNINQRRLPVSTEIALELAGDSRALVLEGSPMIVNKDLAKGGIDLNPKNIAIQTEGNGNKIQFPSQDIQLNSIEGFFPIIINISPATNTPLI